MFQYSAPFLSSLVSTIIWNLFLYAYLLPIKFKFIYELDFMDKLTMLEMFTLSMLVVVSGSFYLGLVIIHCREQVELMDKLRRKMDKFVVQIRQVLDGVRPLASRRRDSPTSHWLQGAHGTCGAALDQLYESINTDLVCIPMHYRIFAAQLKPTRKALSFVLLCCLGLMVVFPIVGRLHVPYIRDRESRITCIIICFIMIGLPDVSIVPICWMNSRCLNLRQSLCNLRMTRDSAASSTSTQFGSFARNSAIQSGSRVNLQS